MPGRARPGLGGQQPPRDDHGNVHRLLPPSAGDRRRRSGSSRIHTHSRCVRRGPLGEHLQCGRRRLCRRRPYPRHACIQYEVCDGLPPRDVGWGRPARKARHVSRMRLSPHALVSVCLCLGEPFGGIVGQAVSFYR